MMGKSGEGTSGGKEGTGTQRGVRLGSCQALNQSYLAAALTDCLSPMSEEVAQLSPVAR